MTTKPESDFAGQLYKEGMQYNWRQDKSPSNAALSRASLERAAALGHTRAIREYAEMLFVGSGGPKDQEHALWLKWSAYRQGDSAALDELSALLDSYAEGARDPATSRQAAATARKAEEVYAHLQSVESFLHGLIRTRKLEGTAE